MTGTASKIMELSTPCDPSGRPVPADASSLIPPALDQLRENPQIGPEEVPSLLERLAEVPDPRDPRGVRQRLAGRRAVECVRGEPGGVLIGVFYGRLDGGTMHERA